MPLRNLLIGAVLVAALGGAVYWSERTKTSEESKPKPDASPKLVTVSEDQVKTVEIRKKDTPPTVVQRDASGNWQITSPKQLGADKESVSSAISALSGLAWERLVEEKASDLSAFGLAAPSVEILATTKDNKRHKLLIGDETPTGTGFFAKLDNDPRVFTVASWTKTSLDKTANDFRDKRLLTFDSDKLTRIELTAKKQTLELGKNNQNEWQILKPQPYRSDSFAVEEIIRKLKDAKMDAAISEEDSKKAESGFRSGQLIATAKVTDHAGTQQIEVRKNIKDNTYFARSSVVEGAHKVADDLGAGLDKGIDDLRNKKLFDFGFDDPNKIEIESDGKTYAFSKAGEKWMSAGKEMDVTSVQALIDKLRDLSSIKFLDTGFSTPMLRIAVTSKDGKRVEKVAVSKNGERYLARRENEPALYELDGKLVGELQSAARDVKPATAPKK